MLLHITICYYSLRFNGVGCLNLWSLFVCTRPRLAASSPELIWDYADHRVVKCLQEPPLLLKSTMRTSNAWLTDLATKTKTATTFVHPKNSCSQTSVSVFSVASQPLICWNTHFRTCRTFMERTYYQMCWLPGCIFLSLTAEDGANVLGGVGRGWCKSKMLK